MTNSFNKEIEKQLISKIILSEGKLNIMYQKEPIIFAQILKVFNISETRQNIEGLYKLKERLINICLQQKQEFLEYLSLPKFRQVSQHALQLLKISLEEISESIKNEQEGIKLTFMVNQLSYFIPPFNSFQQAQIYHLQIFEMYARSEMCPAAKDIMENDRKNMDNFNKYQINQAHSNFVKSQSQFQQYPSPYSRFQPINQRKSRVFDSYEKNNDQKERGFHLTQQGLKYQGHQNNHLKQNISKCSNSFMPQQISGSSQFLQQQSIGCILKQQKIEQTSKLIDENSQSQQQIHSEQKQKIFNAVDPNFKNCLCKGKIQKVGVQQFLCQKCLGKYHFDCMKIENNKDLNKKCPICVVQQVQNPFYEVLKPALISSWAVYNKQNTIPHAIKFSEKLLKAMKLTFSKAGYKLYLKLITITKRSCVSSSEQIKYLKEQVSQMHNNQIIDDEAQSQSRQQNEDQMIDEGKNEQKQLKERNKKQIKSNKSDIFKNHTSIEFNQRYIQELMKYQTPVLSLNFGLSGDQNNKVSKSLQMKEQKVIYYGIYEVRQKHCGQVFAQLSYKIINEYSDQSKQLKNRDTIQSLICNYLGIQHRKVQKIGECYKEEQNLFQQETKFDNYKGKISFLMNLSCSSLDDQKESQMNDHKIYPIRFNRCRDILHVFDLRSYLKGLYGLQQKSQRNITKNNIINSPDGRLNRCPVCCENKQLMEEIYNKNEDMQNEEESSYMYLDKQLYNQLLLHPLSFEEGDNLNIKVLIQFSVKRKYQQKANSKCFQIDYCYNLENNFDKEYKQKDMKSQQNKDQQSKRESNHKILQQSYHNRNDSSRNNIIESTRYVSKQDKYDKQGKQDNQEKYNKQEKQQKIIQQTSKVNQSQQKQQYQKIQPEIDQSKPQEMEFKKNN